MNEKPLPEEKPVDDAEVSRKMGRATRRGFIGALLAAGAGYLGYRWVGNAPEVDGTPGPLRKVLQVNEKLARGYFSRKRLSPEFAADKVQEMRENGDLGLENEIEVEDWRLRVVGLASQKEPLELTLADIKALPRHEMVTQLRCIEGWSVVNQWAGARLADFLAKYPPATKSGQPADFNQRPEDYPAYVGLATPDGGYYVGLEAEAALHPQTLLCYEMNGEALAQEHGAPLRLAIPVKYGIKNLKRIGTMTLTNERPRDYWAENGYDYYAGF